MNKLDRWVLDRVYLAISILEKYRTRFRLIVFALVSAIVLSQFVISEIGQTSTFALVFGFLWLTVPISYLSYYLVRFVLWATLAFNNYSPSDNE